MKTKFIVSLFIVAVFMFPGLKTFDTFKTLVTTKPAIGTIVDCQSRNGSGTSRRGSSRRGTFRGSHATGYAPTLQTLSGDIVKSYRYVTVPCDKVLGHKNLVFVHASDPNKNRSGGFVQFWLMPSLMTFALFMVWIPINAIRTPVAIGYTIMAIFGYMMETGKFGFTKGENDPLMSAEITLERCAKKLARQKKIEDLYTLTRMNCSRLHDISGLRNYPELESILIARSELTNLEDLPYSETLKSLDLYQTQIADISALPNKAPNLEILILRGGAISDLSPVAHLKHLKTITVSGTHISDISALAGKNKLESATFRSPVTDLSPLYGLPNLKIAGASHSKTKYPCSHMTALKESLVEDAVVWVPKHCK